MINILTNLNEHPRDKHLQFYEPTHTYTVNGKKGFTSVTTFVHQHFEPFNADKIIDGILQKNSNRSHKYYGMTRQEIKKQWNDNGKKASSEGTKLHYDIECFYNGIIPDNKSIEYQYFMNFHEDHKTIVPYRTEWMIYHIELKLAGSIDFVVLNDDNTIDLFDWKRCKDIIKNSTWNKYAITEDIDFVPDTNYWHYSIQLNTYKYILEDQYDKKVKNMYLVCLHPDKEGYQKIKVPDMQNEIRQLMENRIK
tara:strand:+ start:511 stop:1263 length:753 start_codon:yes stop_codon:yes gene_type:complete